MGSNADIRDSGNGLSRVADEGAVVDLSQIASTLDFRGDGVIAAIDPTDPTRLIITIPGAVGGGGVSAGTVEGTFACTETEAVGDAVYLFGADAVRQADASSEATAPAIGIIKEKPTSTSCVVATDGELSGFSGLTVGDIYFLSKGSPGGITNIPISGPGVSQKLGEARNSTTLIINIDSDFVILT